MGSLIRTLAQCTRLSLPLPSSPLLLLLAPQPMEPLLPTTQLLSTRRRSFPLSHSPMNMETLMTTPRTTSRRPKLRMLKAKLPDLSRLLFLMAESRPPPTLLTTTTDLLLRLPMKEPLSTHQSPRKDTDMLLQSTKLLPPLLTMLKMID